MGIMIDDDDGDNINIIFTTWGHKVENGMEGGFIFIHFVSWAGW